MALNSTPVPITPGSGASVASEDVTVVGVVEKRQRMQLAGRVGGASEAANDVAAVMNAVPASTDYALAVRTAGRVQPAYFDGTILATTITLVAATITALPTTALTNRRGLWIINNDAAVALYWGGAAVAVSGANKGVAIGPNNQSPLLPFGPNVALKVISAGAISVTVLEVAE